MALLPFANEYSPLYLTIFFYQEYPVKCKEEGTFSSVNKRTLISPLMIFKSLWKTPISFKRQPHSFWNVSPSHNERRYYKDFPSLFSSFPCILVYISSVYLNILNTYTSMAVLLSSRPHKGNRKLHVVGSIDITSALFFSLYGPYLMNYCLNCYLIFYQISVLNMAYI